jgi:hypothetical protein
MLEGTVPFVRTWLGSKLPFERSWDSINNKPVKSRETERPTKIETREPKVTAKSTCTEFIISLHREAARSSVMQEKTSMPTQKEKEQEIFWGHVDILL